MNPQDFTKYGYQLIYSPKFEYLPNVGYTGRDLGGSYQAYIPGGEGITGGLQNISQDLVDQLLGAGIKPMQASRLDYGADPNSEQYRQAKASGTGGLDVIAATLPSSTSRLGELTLQDFNTQIQNRARAEALNAALTKTAGVQFDPTKGTNVTQAGQYSAPTVTGITPGAVPQAPVAGQKYFQFKGSPDVFDAQGNYISAAQAATIPDFFKNVQQLDSVRPDVKAEADFSKYAGKSITSGMLTGGVPTPNTGNVGLPSSTNYGTITSGALASADASIKAAQTEYDKTKADILSKLNELSGQTAYQQSQEQIAGIDEKKRTLADLGAQLAALNAEAKAEQARIENRPLAMGAIIGQQGEAERMRATEALSLSAQIQAAQGNLALAEEQVQKAVDLKYEPLKAQIDSLSKLLDLNYKDLTRAEQKQADALQLQNQIQMKLLDTKIAQEKANDNLLNTALANDAPLSLVTKARALMDAGNSDAAIASLHSYVGTRGNEPIGNLEVSPGFSDAKSEQTVRNEYTKLLTDENNDYGQEEMYNILRRQFGRGVVSDSALQELTGYSPSLPSPESESKAVWWNPVSWF